MKQRERSVLIGCIIIFLALALFEPSYGWEVRQWLAAGAFAPVGGGSVENATSASGVDTFASENEVLKAQLAELANVAATLPHTPANEIRAVVYSRYPFNFKNEFLVDAGTNEGVVTGNAALFQGIFVGTVARVFPDSALVQTVFDDNFKMAVRIGKAGYDALLTGGASPRAVSIVKTAVLTPGDIVYTAAPGVPYDLPVAVVAATSTSPDRLFEEASLGFAYDVNIVQSVVIAR